MPTDQLRKSVELMIVSGIFQNDIAVALGISDETLRKYFADEITSGQRRANRSVIKRFARRASKDAALRNAIEFIGKP